MSQQSLLFKKEGRIFRLCLYLGWSLLACSLSEARFGESPFSLNSEAEFLSSESQALDVSLWRVGGTVGAPLYVNDGQVIALSASYERTHLSWDDEQIAYFDTLEEMKLSVFTLHTLSDWKVLTISSINSIAEEGVSVQRALSYSGIYGGWYDAWETLKLGLGIGYSTQHDEATSIFPILFLDWEFMENWTITTRPTPGTRFGPGVSVMYEQSEQLKWFLGARYLNEEYLLKDGDTFSYEATRFFMTAKYFLTEQLSLSGTAGVNIGGALEWDELTIDLDPSPFIAVDLSWDF